MENVVTIRASTCDDLAGVDRLLQRSYPRLLAADYPPSTRVMALPLLIRARPELLASGRYFVAEDEAGCILAAGGWSAGRGNAETGEIGNVRHVATDPLAVRQGLGRRIMRAAMEDAGRAGIRWVDCLSTRTAVPFYRALGFRVVQPVDIPLGPAIVFPAVRMLGDLRVLAL
jgi:GNAT superfamily N-acetyltransferase